MHTYSDEISEISAAQRDWWLRGTSHCIYLGLEEGAAKLVATRLCKSPDFDFDADPEETVDIALEDKCFVQGDWDFRLDTNRATPVDLQWLAEHLAAAPRDAESAQFLRELIAD